jgi:hypothetical protein
MWNKIIDLSYNPEIARAKIISKMNLKSTSACFEFLWEFSSGFIIDFVMENPTD